MKRKRIPLKKKIMAQQDEFVVQTNPEQTPVLYMTGYNVGHPPSSTFGNLENAVIYETLHDAEGAAAAIGGGTVGTTKPN